MPKFSTGWPTLEATPRAVMRALITIILVLQRWPIGRPHSRRCIGKQAYQTYLKDREALWQARRVLSEHGWGNWRLFEALRLTSDARRGFELRVREHYDYIRRRDYADA